MIGLNSLYRQHKRDSMVARILDAAREIMRAEGVAALSMHELARKLDMRAPSLYHYFSSKMAIYDALFRQGFTLFGETMRMSILHAENWQDELSQSIKGYMEFALSNPELYQLCFERPVPGFVPSQESLQVSFGMLHQYYEHTNAMLAKLETQLDEQQVTDLVIAIMHGLTALHLANQPDLPVGEGRFGSLIPVVVSILDKAWKKQEPIRYEERK